RHALAVVDHGDEAAAAFLQGDDDAPGPRIDGVLDQFLDRTRGPLDHLARGDAVDQGGREAAQRLRGSRAHGRHLTSGRLRKDTGVLALHAPPQGSPVTPTGLPTTTVVMTSSRKSLRVSRRTSSILTALIRAARRVRWSDGRLSTCIECNRPAMALDESS